MVSMRERVSKSGEQTWAVLYREHKRQRSVTFASHEEAAKFAAVAELLGAATAFETLRQGDARPTGPTVAELFEQWIEWKSRDLTVRAAKDYRRDYANWIDPFFGHRPAESITELDVQTWVDKNLSPRLGAKTVAGHHALLHGIFKWAATKKRGIVPSNPCMETELPKRHKTPPKGLHYPEWLALLEASRRIDPDAADLILFLGTTGWRIGEATALLAGAVEDDGVAMFVSVSRVNRKEEGVVEGAKSDAGLRRIRMLSETAQMLRRRLIGLGPGDLVFTNPRTPSGLWDPGTFRTRWWPRAVEAAGLSARRPTPHWLRHTHVMLCHMAGMSLAEIQRRIGHEDIRTTINVYGRMIEDMSDEVFARMDALITPGAQQIAGTVVPTIAARSGSASE